MVRQPLLTSIITRNMTSILGAQERDLMVTSGTQSFEVRSVVYAARSTLTTSIVACYRKRFYRMIEEDEVFAEGISQLKGKRLDVSASLILAAGM